MVKTYKINSPAYKANGNHGTYCSVAICYNNGDFIEVIGDHATDGKCFNGYTNINKIFGLPFSDADRFITVLEVSIDRAALRKWQLDYIESKRALDIWYANRAAKFGQSLYDFIYDKKGRKIAANLEKYEMWAAENPYPKTVAYYDFLKAVKHEN